MRSARLALPVLVVGLASLAAGQTQHWDTGGPFATNTFGGAIDIVHDVDGDGFDDVIVGDLDATPVLFHEGQVRVLSGVDGSPIWILDGQVVLESFGFDVAGVGDVDADGRGDFVVTNTLSAPVLYSGATGTVMFTFTAQGTDGARVVSAAGDANADGVPDIALGAPTHAGSTGRAWIISGAFAAFGTGAEVLHVFDGQAASDSFGQAIDGAGDVDGDGRDDIVVGAPGESGLVGVSPFNGVVRVFSGLDGSVIQFHHYLGPASGYGTVVAGIGDLDLDGFDEVAASAPLHDVAVGNEGAAWVYAGVDGSIQHALTGISAGDFLGWSLDGAGDVSGDGRPDFLVGRVGEGSGGRVRLHSGADGSWWYALSEQGGAYGSAVAGGADLDGDAYADFVVSAPGEGNSGHVHAYRGECIGENEPYCDGLANSVTALGARITASGSTSVSVKDLTLIARDCPPGNLGLFFYAQNAAQMPFGDGLLCATGSVQRLAPSVPIDTQGLASLKLDFDSAPVGGGAAGAILGGDTRYFQFWYRDPTGPGGSGFNLTNGRRITFCP